MADLTPNDFSALFHDIHGYEPFPWQNRLARRVHSQGWPTVVDLPTGTGKTALLDIAVFALATNPKVAPRRIVFVIDRRIVVDQVCERARRIRDRIQAGDTPILLRVRQSLQAIAGGTPLGVTALRGGIPIDGAWTHRPDQPWVLVSTVDQFGSRLLFRGYGVSPRMLPIHAGLAGNDCLVILDEVHLSFPFAETLEQAAKLPVGPLPRRFHIVQMSATPGSDPSESFRLDPITDLEECEELRRRVRSKKRAQLVPVRNRAALPNDVLRLVRSMTRSRTGPAAASVGVVVNRVRSARETDRVLREAGFDTHLLTGRMRPLDRREVLEAIQPAVDPERSATSSEMTIVVATQAIEVGADFSFDALVTECAPIDSLRQRFGRLDRRGRYSERTGSPAQAWIVGLKTVVAGKKPDPIYGDSVKAAWAELKRLAQAGPIDVGPESLSVFPKEATAPRVQAPILLNTHMDAWAQTSPQPILQPPIDWFLHGKDRAAIPDVSIVWRQDRTEAVLRLVPPRQAEFLSVPIDAARSWLSGGPETEIADVQVSGVEDAGGETVVSDCLRWRGIGKPPERIESAGDIRPGDTLVVDPGRGGLRSCTWDPSSGVSVEDLGDAAQEAHGHRVTLRLDPDLSAISALSPAPPSPADELDDAAPRERIQTWLDTQRVASDDMPEWLASTVMRLSKGFEYTLVRMNQEEAGSYYVLAERNPNTLRPVIDPTVMDGSDEAGSMTGSAVTLRQHLDGVATRAREIGMRLGFPREIVEDMWLAGRLHDIGKVDRRFQEQLVGGDPVDLEMLDEPLAKSAPGVRRVWRYPRGMRHELASVAMAGSDREVLAQAHDPELVLHLIGTHHGWARPLAPVITDPNPQELAYTLNGWRLWADSELSGESLALDMAERFWHLIDRYGYYGLAWLETIVRLADHRQSAEEDTQP